jgi:hypothetical protein
MSALLVGKRNTIDQFRYVTANMLIPTLRRKHCSCGVMVTAKQLVQYGRCDKCVRGAL